MKLKIYDEIDNWFDYFLETFWNFVSKKISLLIKKTSGNYMFFSSVLKLLVNNIYANVW